MYLLQETSRWVIEVMAFNEMSKHTYCLGARDGTLSVAHDSAIERQRAAGDSSDDKHMFLLHRII